MCPRGETKNYHHFLFCLEVHLFAFKMQINIVTPLEGHLQVISSFFFYVFHDELPFYAMFNKFIRSNHFLCLEMPTFLSPRGNIAVTPNKDIIIYVLPSNMHTTNLSDP